ncbi:hypothetical protein GYMLUDRAFT_41533 [Collybiopsis luxurians FD-317 M1]|uniref:Protein kinase domain-containing protein n=1 Tax=Collybiopsis luxurians FD-317 M1 TaxID=944289 RepID=A0A0D0BGX5_9AGAR|nr:hypothetical protein GYMLUDRAFT_41533 [Collybiopsis luxurians FD-317 M1]
MRWLAPEYIFSSTTPVMNHTSRDIYAFGCTIVEILTQKLPFYDHKTDALVMFNLMNGGRPTRPQGVWCPDVAWNLITRCWTQDAQDRPLASEIHEILQSVLGSVSPVEHIGSYPMLAGIAAESPSLGIDASLWAGQPKPKGLEQKRENEDKYYLSHPSSFPSTLASKELPPVPNHPSRPPSPFFSSTSSTGLSSSSMTGSLGAGSIVTEPSNYQLPPIPVDLPSSEQWLSERNNVHTSQVVILGAGSVGKSALIARFVHDIFLGDYDYDPTIEDSYWCNITVDGETSFFEAVDLSGLEEYRRYNEMHIRAGKAFVLVFSLTQEASLEEVDYLRKQIYRTKGDTGGPIPIVVVGTKLDLASERVVYQNTIQYLASQWGLPFYETSAKSNWHVSEVFEHLVREMRAPQPTPRHPTVEKLRTSKKKGPCLIM